MLGEGPPFGINESFRLAEKKFSIDFSKANTTFCFSLHYKTINCYLGSISHGFSTAGSREVSLNGNVYDFSINYNSFDKFDIFDIHK